MANRLHYGDNLEILRAQVQAESVDLIYLDPPFNSKADYNIISAPPRALRTQRDARHAQIEAFEDTWHWNDKAEDAFDQVARSGNTKAFDLLNALRAFLGENDMMAYLSMMAIRLIELHRVLKPTGSLYLHCDPTASHYLKLLLDGVFGADQFTSEVIWKRTGTHSSANRWGPVHDTLFFYSKSQSHQWNRLYIPLGEDHHAKHYRHQDSEGRRFTHGELTAPGTRNGRSGASWRGFDVNSIGRHWMTTVEKLDDLLAQSRIYLPQDGSWPRLIRYEDEGKDGRAVGDTWTDIPPINMQAKERLGYPTQKPLALLERIIAASSNEGDVVLDPFCGCGTAVHAAQKLGRQWIGIDITHLAISLIEKRMKAAFPGVAFTVEGTPRDLASAEDLARRDKYQFQWWAVSMVDAMPYGGKKKGADGGVDGIIYFKPDGKRTEKAIVSVKGGDHVGVQMIRDLHSAMEREKAPIGVFITKALPTAVMEREAAAVGRFHAEATGRSYPRLQILTLAELFAGRKPDIPYVDPNAAFRTAARETSGAQPSLL